MAELETYNPYTLADIERYLQGKMTAAEMHAMEKAALQDPFLSDAIEGYSRAPLDTAHAHLDEITAALFAENEEAKVIAMPVKKRSWANWGAAAAAVAAVILAAVFITYPSDKEAKQNLAAKQTNTPVFTDTLKNQEPVANAPSTGPIADIPPNNNTKAATKVAATLATIESKPRREDDYKVEMKKEVVPNANAIVPDSLRQAQISTVTVQSPVLIADKDADKNLTANNYSVSNNSNSGPSYVQNNTANLQVPVTANSRVLKNSKPVNIDSAGGVLTGRAAGLNVQPNKEMFLQPEFKAKRSSGNPMQIVLTPIPNFDTVAITYLNNKNKSPKMVIDSSVSPQGGWANFRDYVVKRLDKKATADTSDLAEGDVELEFTIDDSGLAKDIKITRSLGIAHDAQAADLVKKWPGWVTSKKQKKGKVVIQF